MNIENIRRLLEFDTPTVGNGVELMGIRDPATGYTGPDVRALMPEMGVRVGVAVTARMDTTSAGTDDPPSLFKDWLRLMRDAAKGGMPVFALIQAVGPRPRCTVSLGDGMAMLMRLAGAVGFLTDGGMRDLEGVREVGLACWAAGLSPMHGRLRWLDLNTTVIIDGMTVRPGDIIHADVNGSVVIPREVVDQACDKAIEVRKKEQGLFARWRAPGFTLDEY
ncbi:MAG: hypothetical protein A3F84_07510, partial [Candidatus Handelsmanbacteria bacterium RIFCSPLOWO2_12_FULL_64_10]